MHDRNIEPGKGFIVEEAPNLTRNYCMHRLSHQLNNRGLTRYKFACF